MSRCEILEWKSCYELEFLSVIHVYKKCWSPYVGEKLMCKMDNRQEAKENDEYAIGAYDKSKKLCGHVPIELSFLCYTF